MNAVRSNPLLISQSNLAFSIRLIYTKFDFDVKRHYSLANSDISEVINMKFWTFGMLLIVSFGFACGIPNKATAPAASESKNAKIDTRNIVGFKKIKAESAIELNVSVTNGFSIVIEADDDVIYTVRTALEGDTLAISLKNKTESKSKITVTIHMPELTALDLTGATTANVTGVKADELKIDATGAAKVKINGEAKTLKVKAVGASSVDAENLKTEKAEVESVGASSITVAASEELKADATGASSVIYIGDPKQLKQNASDVSTIRKK